MKRRMILVRLLFTGWLAGQWTMRAALRLYRQAEFRP